MSQSCDFLILGGGMAGASLGYHLVPHGKTILCEMESQPGYHTTGRSAAFYAESYGSQAIRPLTMCSKDFLKNPPYGFSEVPLITKRGAVHIFKEDKRQHAEDMCKEMQELLDTVQMMSRQEAIALAPILSATDVAGAISDPDCGDLDVSALHQGFLRGYKQQGGEIVTDAEMIRAYRDADGWVVETRAGEIKTNVLVNCAGAWGDVVAERAGVQSIGLTPLRRTIVMVPAENVDPAAPIVIEIDEEYYFKPDSGQYLVSPADETLSPACDAQPEMEDVAIAVDRFERATNTRVEKVENSWAGLRTFSPDRGPVIGYDDKVEGFFWSVGQGGYGIQTAPAWGATAAHLIVSDILPKDIAAMGVNKDIYSPSRFRK